MDLSQVKMVVTDMDGTLLNSKSEVSDQFFELFDTLKTLNIQFVAASGRQYSSIQDKLMSIAEEITIVAENGGYIKQAGTELGSIHLSEQHVNKLIPLLRAVDDIHIVLCGKRSAYIEKNDARFIHVLKEYYTKFEVVEDLLTEVKDDCFKVAIYHFESSETFIYPHVKHLESELQVKVSGSNWVDIADQKSNKGEAIKLLQRKFGISKEETMVFGDYNNDLEMIDQAYFSYAMENAHENVKLAARFQTGNNNSAGVETILKRLIESKKTKT